MNKFDVQIALEKVADARKKWSDAHREFQAGVDKVMTVLLHEAARNYMSPTDVGKSAGLSRVQVVNKMKAVGLHPHDGKRMLSEKAAKALNENAELLGVNVHDIDLMSPLAYLPMGDQLRRELERKTAPSVTEFPETADLTEDERAAIDEAAAMYGVTNGDLITLINALLCDRASR